MERIALHTRLKPDDCSGDDRVFPLLWELP